MIHYRLDDKVPFGGPSLGHRAAYLRVFYNLNRSPCSLHFLRVSLISFAERVLFNVFNQASGILASSPLLDQNPHSWTRAPVVPVANGPWTGTVMLMRAFPARCNLPGRMRSDLLQAFLNYPAHPRKKKTQKSINKLPAKKNYRPRSYHPQ